MWAQDGPATKQEPAGTGPSDTLSSRQSQRHIPCAPGEQDAIRLSSGRRRPNTGRGIRGVNTKPRAGRRKQDQSPPGPTSRRRQGWPRRRRPGAASGAWEALGARLRGTRPPARCALSGRAEGTGCAEAPPPFPGETAWATGTLQAASGLAFSGSESLQVHPLTLTPTAWQPSRLSSHGAENKAAEGGGVCQEKQPGPQGAVWGGQQPPPAGFRTKVPGQPGALLEAKWSRLEASAPHALGAPATGRTTPQASAAKVVPGSRTRRTEVEGRAPAALLPLRKNDARDPEAAAGPSAGLPQPAVPRATLWQRREKNQGGRTTRGPGEFGNQQPQRAHAAPGKRVTTLPKVTRHHALQAVVPHARPWPMRLRSSSTSVARGHSGGQRPR